MVEFTYLVFVRMSGESYRRRLRSLLLCLCDIFRALMSSIVCWCSNGEFLKKTGWSTCGLCRACRHQLVLKWIEVNASGPTPSLRLVFLAPWSVCCAVSDVEINCRHRPLSFIRFSSADSDNDHQRLPFGLPPQPPAHILLKIPNGIF